MADDPQSGQERTEQPTARRRAKAREEGRVARSAELSSAVVVLATAAVLASMGGRALAELPRRLMQECWGAMSFGELGRGGAAGLVRLAAGGFLSTFLVFSGGVVALVVLVNVVQAKGVMSWQPVSPKLSHLNPVAGVKRLFSPEALFTGLKAVLKLTAIGLVTWFVVGRTLTDLTALTGADARTIAVTVRHVLLRLAVVLGIAYLVLAAIDYAWQRYRMEQSLRMSRQEVQYEHKDTEGNPQVKARLQALARTHARRRMLQQVPNADVVVANPTHIAVALKYDTAISAAPVVLAMGQRKLAERIKRIARKADVPVIENRAVARALLATAKVGQPIPPALYAAVAEILAFVYRRRYGGRIPNTELVPGRAS
jgi:flagellar biosynthetic protein FlhB